MIHRGTQRNIGAGLTLEPLQRYRIGRHIFQAITAPDVDLDIFRSFMARAGV